MEVGASDIDLKWKEAFPQVKRPQLYTSDMEDEHGFLPINDSQSFSEDTTTMTSKQLHVMSCNNQLALKQAQDEYLEIESVVRRLTGKDPKRNPQAPQGNQEFEGRHESALYGYKYADSIPVVRNNAIEDVADLEKRDVQHHQDPFVQGGFFPTPKQYATKVAKATDKRNPDGWKPVEKDGKLLIPRVQQKHEEYARHQPWTQEDIEAARAGSEETEQTLTNGTPSKPVDKRLTRTRYDGQKVPFTRDISEDPYLAPSPRFGRGQTPRSFNARQMTPLTMTEDGSPVPRKRQRLDLTAGGNASTGTTPAPTSQSRQRARAGQASVPTEPLSPRSMRNWKWTNEGLLAAIKKDYLWLHPDPVKALVNKDKLLNAANPVRTWSMCNKWIEWHEKGLDKRPRNKDGTAKGADVQAVSKLGLALAVVESIEQQGDEPQAVKEERSVSADLGRGSRKNSASELRMKKAGSWQNSHSGSRKNSAADMNFMESKRSDQGSRKSSIAGSRKHSAASIDIANARIKRTSSAASIRRRGSASSIRPPSSTRSSRGAKRKYTETNDDSDDEETLQIQANRQLLHETVDKEDKDGDFKVRTPKNEVLPNTPTRRSLRGRSQADGS